MSTSKVNVSTEVQIVTVNVNAPDNKEHLILLVNLCYGELLRAISEDPYLCFFTNYGLYTELGLIDDSSDLLSEVKDGELKLEMKIEEFNETTMLYHSALFARIVFTFTDQNYLSDCFQTEVSFIYNHYRDCDFNSMKQGDFEGLYCKKYLESNIAKLLIDYDLSQYQFTNMEKLRGLLLKFRLKTIENNEYIIYGSKKGFFVSENAIFQSLHLLVESLSDSFKMNIIQASKRWCNMDTSERLPLDMNNLKTLFPISDKNFASNYKRLNLFLERSELSWKIDDLIDLMQNEPENESMIYFYETLFLKKVLKCFNQVLSGTVNSLVSGEKCYLIDNLYFARLDTLLSSFPEKTKETTIHKLLTNELRVFPFIRNLDSRFKATRTTLVNYLNEIWFVQCSIPGVEKGNINIVYGPSQPERDVFLRDEKCDEFFKNYANKLSILGSKIENSDELIYTTKQTNCTLGLDGNYHIVDFHNITPRDFNFGEHDDGYFIRKEAIIYYEEFLALSKHNDELVNLGCNPKYFYKTNKLEGIQKREEILSNVDAISFDINARITDPDSDEKKKIFELSTFIKDKLVPFYVEERLLHEEDFISNQSIVDGLHIYGINLRYLGFVYKYLSDRSHDCVKLDIIESEIICRSIKQIVRDNKLDIDEVITLINQFKSSDSIPEIVIYKAKEKFHHQIQKTNSFITNICIRSLSLLGIQLTHFSLNIDISQNDIKEVEPKIKYNFVENVLISSNISTATTCYKILNIDSLAVEYLRHAKIMASVSKKYDKYVDYINYYLSELITGFSDNEIEEKFRLLYKSTVIHQLYGDISDQENIIRYINLAKYSKFPLSLAFIYRAINLSKELKIDEYIYISTASAVNILLKTDKYRLVGDLALQVANLANAITKYKSFYVVYLELSFQFYIKGKFYDSATRVSKLLIQIDNKYRHLLGNIIKRNK